MKLQLPDNIVSLQSHQPTSPEEEKGELLGGTDFANLAFNENPWGPSPKVIRALRSNLTNQHKYPEKSGLSLRNSLAEKVNLTIEEIIIGNGPSDILNLLFTSLACRGDEVIISRPFVRMYHPLVQIHGVDSFALSLIKNHHDLESILSSVSEKTRFIILDNPNNPTGSAINPGELYSFLSKVPESVVVILDESFVDFMEPEYQVDVFSLVRNHSGRCGVVVLRSFSHAYGLAGLRVGYGLMPLEICTCISKVQQPFHVNKMALVGANAALQDDEYYQKVVKMVQEGRDLLQAGIEKTGCRVHLSQANFLLVETGMDSRILTDLMLQKGVAVASMEKFDLPSSIRVSVGTERENQHFLEVFNACLKEVK
ncbi:MAG: histidinol-phosphate transaminase [Bacteroidetes bacterium]|nr:histidinol-phosphate transaminase [Bacteroidota bacterium]